MPIAKNSRAKPVIYAASVLLIEIALVGVAARAEEQAAQAHQQSGGSPKPQPAFPEKQFNWAAPRLVPADVEIRAHSVALKAGGEQVVLDGALFKVEATEEVSTRWNKEVLGRITVFSLELRADRPVLVKEVQWFAGRWDKMDETVIHSTGLEDNVLFLRKGKISFFLSLDPGPVELAVDIEWQ